MESTNNDNSVFKTALRKNQKINKVSSRTQINVIKINLKKNY